MKLTTAFAPEAAIWRRLIQPAAADLSPDAARSFLSLGFAPTDKTRRRQLAAKARQGTPTPDEQAELNGYERVAYILFLLKSKARKSLKSVQ